jgi:branched-chain amino acid transport system permease protein
VQYFVTGILVGGIYALIALGIVVIYKSTKVFNFATGQMMVVGAFFCWSLMKWLGFPSWAGFVGALPLSYLIGLFVERLAMRPLIGQPLIGAMMACLSLSVLLHGLVILVWSAYVTSFPTPIFPKKALIFGNVAVSGGLLGAFLIAIVAFCVFALFFQRTATGLTMRGTAEDHELAQSTGVRVKSVFALTWGIAGILCCISGVVLADRLALGVTETSAIAFKVFPAVLLGGLDSILGVLVGGIVVGLTESLTAGFIDPIYAQITPYIILLIVLLIRPEGLWGLKRIERI